MKSRPELTEAEQDALALRVRAGFRAQFEDMAVLRKEIRTRRLRMMVLRLLPLLILFAGIGVGIGWFISRL